MMLKCPSVACYFLIALLATKWLVGCSLEASKECKVQSREGLDGSASDKEFLDFLTANELLSGQKSQCQDEIDGDFVSETLQKGFYNSAVELIKACSAAGVRIEDKVRVKVNALRQKLSEVTAVLDSAARPVSVVAPAFEWAQSDNSVIIGVKFSHKLGVPACTNIVDDRFEASSNSVSLNVTCRGKNKLFKLELPLYSTINPDQSSWSLTSVGRGTMTLAKMETGRWERLLMDASGPKNMAVWWTMQEKYDKEREARKLHDKSNENAANAIQNENSKEHLSELSNADADYDSTKVPVSDSASEVDEDTDSAQLER